MPKIVDDDFEDGAAYVAPQVGFAAPPVNPLQQYYRVPGLSVVLPTHGVFMPEGSIVLDQAGGLSVQPMRAQDELLLKNPDALMSGHAIERLIESCAPGIVSAKMISTPDLDVLLLAIRAATYGDTMTMSAPCPKCKTDNDYTTDLSEMLGTTTFIDPQNPVRLSDDVVVYIRPYNLHNATSLALASFEEARKHQALDINGAEQNERLHVMNESVDRLARMNMHILADCIIKVVVPTATVDDRRSIFEFVSNVKKPWVGKIEKELSRINSIGVDKSVHAVCSNPKCKHEWTTEVEFNPSTFFAEGSSR